MNKRNGKQMITINMMSSATKVKGQGVGSAYTEQLKLMQERLSDTFEIVVNKSGAADIIHYHTVDFGHYMQNRFNFDKSVTVGSVHFLPETLEQSIKLPRPAKKIFYQYLLDFYRRMDYLVVVNPYFIDRLQRYGIDPERVQYIPNFVSYENFFPEPPARKGEIRREYEIDQDAFVVLTVGQLQTRKGFWDFLALAKKMPEVQFVWAGGFSFKGITDGYKEIKEAIEEDCPPNCKFLGIVDREKMNDIYNMASVMFLPSFEELFPMTILESMNCRVPILLRDIDIYHNILDGFYLGADGLDGFEAAIRRLKDDPAYYETYAQKAADGHGFYSEEHVASIWKDFYTRIYAHKPPQKRSKRMKHVKHVKHVKTGHGVKLTKYEKREKRGKSEKHTKHVKAVKPIEKI